jgi:hypothetical protein
MNCNTVGLLKYNFKLQKIFNWESITIQDHDYSTKKFPS